MLSPAVKPCSSMKPDVFQNNILELPHTFLYDEAMPVFKHNDGIGRFVYRFDKLLIEHKRRPVKLSQKYHISLKFRQNSGYSPQNPRRLRGDPKNYTAELKLSLKAEQLLYHRIGNRDNTGVCLIASLCCDHVRELVREVDVRHLKRVRNDSARALFAGS